MNRLAAWLVVAALVAPPAKCAAQGLLEFDPSVRSVSMAGASSAVFWGEAPNAWANPALLGTLNGVRFDQGGYGIVGYMDEPDVKVRGTSLGWGGVGFASTGLPLRGLGYVLTNDLSSSDIAPLEERVRGWSAGVSAGRVLAALAARAGRPAPAVTRFADVALGYGEHRVDELYELGDGRGGRLREDDRVTTRDLGVFVRAGLPVHAGRLGAGRLDAAYGFAAINLDAPVMHGISAGALTARDRRNGVAVHATLDGPIAMSRSSDWMLRGFMPLVSLGWAMDFVHSDDCDAAGPGFDLDGWGAELGLANLLFLRLGQRGTAAGDQVTHARGIGVGMPFGRYASVRYDRASFPEYMPGWRYAYERWSVRLDPLAIWQDGRSHGGARDENLR